MLFGEINHNLSVIVDNSSDVFIAPVSRGWAMGVAVTFTVLDRLDLEFLMGPDNVL